MFDPHRTAAEWYLEGVNPEALPQFARDALEKGYSGKNLAQLATLVKPAKRDVDELVDGVFGELNLGVPSNKQEAAQWMLQSAKAEARSSNISRSSLVGHLLVALPELEEGYLQEFTEYYGLPGNYWVFAVILKPYMVHQLAISNNKDFFHRLSRFLEAACNSPDPEVVNVLWIEVFKWLVHSPSSELEFLWPILGDSTKTVIKEVARRTRAKKKLPT